MGYFWIVIYILFVIFIVTFFFWSSIILQHQKKAWAGFARKNKLRYRSGRFMEPSAVDGNFRDFQIGLFSEAQQDARGRGITRYRTIIEVLFGEGMPTSGAVANEAALPVINALNFGPTYHPKDPAWNNAHVVTIKDRKFLDAYLTNTRLERLNSFLNMNKAIAMFVFDDVETFLRIETADPMTDVSKIEKLMNKLIPLAQELRLTHSERENLFNQPAGPVITQNGNEPATKEPSQTDDETNEEPAEQKSTSKPKKKSARKKE